MANADEIGRIADAVAAIRPEWPLDRIQDYLAAHHTHRPFDILVSAAVFVAAQRKANDLSLLEQDGHWWIEVPAVPPHDPENQKIGRHRDAEWWAKFNAAAAQRKIRHGAPVQETPEEDA